MGQVDLGAMFMNVQVASVNTNDIGFIRETKQLKEQSFSKELDKAKTLQKKDEHKSHSNKMREDKSNEIVQKEKGKIERSDTLNQEKIEVESEDELDEDQDNGELDDKILLLLSETLNVDLEELKELLKQMGYVPSDLLEQQKFGQFISETYAQIKGEDLLMIETGVKGMSALFTQLQEMNNETKVINSEKTIERLVEENQQVNQHFNSINFIESQINHGTIGTESIGNSIQSNEFQSAEIDSNLLNGISTHEAGQVDVGIVVPIQNFSSTVYTQLWKPDGTTSVQTPQLIEANMIDQIDFKTLGITKEIHLQLSPKELGELSIRLIEENSSIVAHIKVDNEKAKMFLLNQLNDLREALEERGLTVVDVKVDINQDSRQSQMEQEKQKSSKRIQEIISKHLEVLEEKEAQDAKESSDSEVDYMV